MRQLLLLATAASAWAGQTWTVRLEEPTGIYRRDDEVVRVRLPAGDGYVVTDSKGVVGPSQYANGELLFQASLIPGQTPEYRVHCCSTVKARFDQGLFVRKVGMRRVEFGNKHFRMVIDSVDARVVEAYNLSAGRQRVLNLVETTPEKGDPADLHKDNWKPLPAVPGVDGENTGWTSLKRAPGALEILEAGPLQGRIRIGDQEWTWTSAGKWVRWRSPSGFRFAAVSASPFLPFDRFVDTSESELWPDVSSTTEPDHHDVAARAYKKMRGGHGVYYQLAENYGALGIVALDERIEWTGIGSRRFEGRGGSDIAVTFPQWDGFRTLLNARRENRIVRQPVLTRVTGPVEGTVPSVPAAVVPRTGSGPPSPFNEQSISLDGEWQLAFCDKGSVKPEGEWRTAQVPGTAHIQWLGRDKAMTRDAEWISGKEWWYRKLVRIPDAWAAKHLRLRFEATDYYAETWINGVFLGRHEGYIDPYEYNIEARGEVELLVRTWTPVSYYWRHRPYTIKGSYGAVDQKPDNITALGITRSVRLIASDGPVIHDLAVSTHLTGNGGAEVHVELAEEHDYELTLSPRNFQSSERYQIAGRGRRFVIPVAKPQLWWTRDHGKPNLYTLDVRLLQEGRATDGRSLAVGIREIEHHGMQFYLNRRKMFIRGTNYYYNLFLSEMDRKKYERDIDLMLGMNVNMIRLHCHFSNPEFYDLADERGVLIWQDFLEAWYPEDTAFSLHAAKLYDNHIRYVRNHPSVAVWAPSDEESLENYRDLSKHLAARAALLDPQRRAVQRSTGRYGDQHVYNGWYGGSIWEYGQSTDVFISELGATSLPNYETLVKFMPNHWPIRDHEQEWIWRKLQIPEAMRAWGDPGTMTMQEYIPKTQAYTSRLFQIALERARRRKGEGTGGILHFHAIDIWPSITMAAIDMDRRPTKTYYTVQRSFQPVLASIEYDRDRWKLGEPVKAGIWAINDTWEAIPNARIEWMFKNGKKGSFSVHFDADSARKIGVVEWVADGTGPQTLTARVLDSTGKLLSENIFEFEVTQ